MSKIKTIYILRHGQTDLNKMGMVQGRGVNASLNETGRAQAKDIAAHLKDVQFDRIYTSELKRTHETVEHFGEPKVALEGFDEISWGNQEGVKPTEASKTLYQQTLDQWRAGDLNANVGGGESPLEVKKRQQQAMDQVLSNGDQTILICMHGRAMRILVSWLLSYPLELMDGFEHSNCCYYKLTYLDGAFRVEHFNKGIR